MVIHFFTLLALSREFSRMLAGAAVEEIFTQQKGELLITFSSGDNARNPTLCISIEPRSNYVYLRATFSRAKKNSSDLFSSLLGAVVRSIGVLPFERTLQIEFADGRHLILLLYNTIEANILLVDDQRIISESFKNNKVLQNSTFIPTQLVFDARVLTEREQFIASLTKQASPTVFSAIKSIIPILGAVYTRELLFLIGIDERSPVGSLAQDDIDKLFLTLTALLYDLEHPSPAVYANNDSSRMYSLVPLTHLKRLPVEEYATVNESVQRFIFGSYRRDVEVDERNLLLKKMQNEITKTTRGVELLSTELEKGKRSEEYAAIGKTLMANLREVSKGMKEIELSDPTQSHVNRRIALDPALTPVENAERYFQKSKKAKTNRIESVRRFEIIERKLSTIRRLHSELEECGITEEVKKFLNNNRHELLAMNFINDTSKKELPPFRIFVVAGGFEVWVGKSSANNDLLTMKYAKPNDLWFHVRGASGSHTVLKVSSKTEKPPREAIREAAAIAVYYSKMRKAGQVPVAYCERKYVHKPKGAATGAVVLEREEVIFVKPKLPETVFS